jgi:hypothetical protein
VLHSRSISWPAPARLVRRTARCEAVGYTNQASAFSLVEQWNGSSWL